MPVESFSGAHPFRPACLTTAWEEEVRLRYPDEVDIHDDAVEFVMGRIAVIDDGRCARCETALAEGEIPSGSRVTECRCIPICSLCSGVEAYSDLVSSAIEAYCDWFDDRGGDPSNDFVDQSNRVEALGPLTAGVTRWPVNRAEQELGMAIVEGSTRTEKGTATTNDDGDIVILTESGVHPIKLRHSPGGWLEFGFDNSEDRADRES